MELPPSTPSDRDEMYLRLLAEHERALATYVYSLVNSPADAADILQECKLNMWRMFDRFELGTDFRAWGRKIAIHQILNFRRAVKRRPDSPLDQAFIEAIATEIDRRADQLDHKADILRLCLRKLPDPHRAVVVWRYFDECGIEEIAAKSDRTEEAVYRLLSRIRKVLNGELTRFVREDTDGLATFIIVRETGETHASGLVHAFASKEHPTARPPTLRTR